MQAGLRGSSWLDEPAKQPWIPDDRFRGLRFDLGEVRMEGIEKKVEFTALHDGARNAYGNGAGLLQPKITKSLADPAVLRIPAWKLGRCYGFDLEMGGDDELYRHMGLWDGLSTHMHQKLEDSAGVGLGGIDHAASR